MFFQSVDFVFAITQRALILAEALHWTCEKYLVCRLQLFMVCYELMNWVGHPWIQPSFVLFLVVIATVRWVPALHSHWFLLECENCLEREVKHNDNDSKYYTFLVPSLERCVHSVLPKNICRLRSFIYFDLLSKQRLILLKLGNLHSFVVNQASIESFFRLKGDEDRAWSLHLIKQFLVVS